jgi:hypothetical protein
MASGRVHAAAVTTLLLCCWAALSVNGRQLKQKAVQEGEPELPGLPKVLQEVSRRAAEALAAAEAAAEQADLPEAVQPNRPTSQSVAHNEAANALTPAQRSFVEGLTDYLFFELAYSPDEQRLAWSSWSAEDKDLYNDYNGFWITATPEQRDRFITLIPFIGVSYNEFISGLGVYLDSREDGAAENLPERLGMDSELRYAYFKYDLYWSVLSESERAALAELVGRAAVEGNDGSSGGGTTESADLPSDPEEFKQGIAWYLGFLLGSAQVQQSRWEGFSQVEKERFYNYQRYWTALSSAQQAEAVKVVAGESDLDALPSRTAQQEFLIGLNQYLIFLGRPQEVQQMQWAGFSAEVREAFIGYRQYWTGLNESERREHVALIRSVLALDAATGGNLPSAVVNPAASEEFLLQIWNYLRFQQLEPAEQEAAWATLDKAARDQFGRVQDYWLGLDAAKQAGVIERIRDLQNSIPFPNIAGLSWEQIQFLLALKEYLDVMQLSPPDRVQLTQTWTLARWEKFNEYDVYWRGLSAEDQQTLVTRLNAVMAGAPVESPPSVVGYQGTLTIKERQFLKGLRLYLDFSARPGSEQAVQLSGLNADELAAYTGYKAYWEALPTNEREELLQRMQEPGILDVQSDLSTLAEAVPGTDNDIYDGDLTIRERQFLKGLSLYLEFTELPLSQQQAQVTALTPAQRQVFAGFESFWRGQNEEQRAVILSQMREPGVLDVSSDLGDLSIIPSGTRPPSSSTGEVDSRPYTGSLSIRERQFLKGLSLYLDFAALSSEQQVVQLDALDEAQRQVIQGYQSYWVALPEAERTQIIARLQEPGILNVSSDLGDLSIPSRNSAPSSSKAAVVQPVVNVQPYIGSLSVKERQFLKGLSLYLDFAALPSSQQVPILNGLSEAQRQVIQGFQSYWVALPEQERAQITARLQEPGILNIESNPSLEVDLPGVVRTAPGPSGLRPDALDSSSRGTPDSASLAGRLSIRERQFLKALKVYLDFIDQPLRDQAAQLAGLNDAQRAVFEGLQAYWTSQSVVARTIILEQLAEPGILDVESDTSLMFDLGALSAVGSSASSRSADVLVDTTPYVGPLSVRERQFLKGLQNYLDFTSQSVAVQQAALARLDEGRRQVFEGFQTYWLALPDAEKGQLLERIAEPGILNVDSDQSLMIQPAFMVSVAPLTGSARSAGAPVVNLSTTTPLPSTTPPPTTTTTPPPTTTTTPAPLSPLQFLQFPGDFVLPTPGMVTTQLGTLAAASPRETANFIIGLRSYLFILTGVIPESVASQLPAEALATLNVYDSLWNRLSETEQAFLRAVVARIPPPS